MNSWIYRNGSRNEAAYKLLLTDLEHAGEEVYQGNIFKVLLFRKPKENQFSKERGQLPLGQIVLAEDMWQLLQVFLEIRSCCNIVRKSVAGTEYNMEMLEKLERCAETAAGAGHSGLTQRNEYLKKRRTEAVVGFNKLRRIAETGLEGHEELLESIMQEIRTRVISSSEHSSSTEAGEQVTRSKKRLYQSKKKETFDKRRRVDSSNQLPSVNDFVSEDKYPDRENEFDFDEDDCNEAKDSNPSDNLDTTDTELYDLCPTQESTCSTLGGTTMIPLRRSIRQTGGEIKAKEYRLMREQIATGLDEKNVKVVVDSIKGRGCHAAKNFKRREFVIDYRGKLLKRKEAMETERNYYDNPDLGSYMYFFDFKNKRYCIDSTEESEYKARLVNHSRLKPNLKMQLFEFDGHPHLTLTALRNISIGEELVYDYGKKRPEILALFPWIENS